MAVSKRLRYEVLRRDNHACRYCGASAPDVTLTVDHVIPTALGGGDEPGNLVTACMPCNSGKSASVPDAPLVRDVDESALRWSRAMSAAADQMLADLQAREQAHVEVERAWSAWTHGSAKRPAPRPADWRQTVDTFVAAGLPVPVLIEAVRLAMANTKLDVESVWRYMCGIAWRKVTELQKAARQLADEPGGVVAFSKPQGAADLARRLLTDFFEERLELYLSQAQAEHGELADEQLYPAALECALDELISRAWRLECSVVAARETIAPELRAPLERLARAECDQHFGAGQYSSVEVAALAIYYATHQDEAPAMAIRLGIEWGRG